jgi:hypothetical protein
MERGTRPRSFSNCPKHPTPSDMIHSTVKPVCSIEPVSRSSVSKMRHCWLQLVSMGITPLAGFSQDN